MAADPRSPRRDWRRLVGPALVVAALLAAGLLTALVGKPAEPDPAEAVTLPVFLASARDGQVAEVTLDAGRSTAAVTPTAGGPYQVAYPSEYADELVAALLDADVPFTTIPAPRSGRPLILDLVSIAVPLGIVGAIFLLLRRTTGGLGALGALSGSKAKPVETPSARFADVAGCDEAIEDLSEAVEFLQHPDRFTSLGARVPKGILLVGPPGTGKTLLARAVAGEASVPFFALSGSDFVETFVGLGARRVRDVFATAREHDGGAIIFIDELDTLGKARSLTAHSTASSEEREQTLNQLLVEMDGFATSRVLVIAATNRPDVLDPALLRPGRFDRRVSVPRPDVGARTRILSLYAAQHPLAEDVDLVALARRTVGLTGADLAALLNEAAILAARRGSAGIGDADLAQALATQIMGRERRSAVVTEEDRWLAAHHEAGHATAALCLRSVSAPVEVSIVPRGGAGGVTWLEGGDEAFLSRSAARERLVLMMAGRAAEELVRNGDPTQGAADDLARATALALQMTCQWGMGPLGPVSFGPDVGGHLLADEAVQAAVRSVLDEAAEVASRLVGQHRGLLEAIAAALLAEESIRRDELIALAAEHGTPPRTHVELDAT